MQNEEFNSVPYDILFKEPLAKTMDAWFEWQEVMGDECRLIGVLDS